MIYKRVNREFKAGRKNLGLSQAVVAKRLGYITSQFVSNWERNLCSVPPKDWKKLCKLLEVDPVLRFNLAHTDHYAKLVSSEGFC